MRECRVDGLTVRQGARVSTERGTGPGGKLVADGVVREAKALVEQARGQEAEQLDLLGVPTPEAMMEAREALGPKAGTVAVLAEARKRGRRPGSRNRRTDDFARYLLGFGQHPAITMMEIQSTPPEVLVERSAALDPAKRRLSYGDAQALRVRCAEGLLPYIESKKPVAVDMNFSGVSDLIIEGVTHTTAELADIIEADFMPVDDDEEDAA